MAHELVVRHDVGCAWGCYTCERIRTARVVNEMGVVLEAHVRRRKGCAAFRNHGAQAVIARASYHEIVGERARVRRFQAQAQPRAAAFVILLQKNHVEIDDDKAGPPSKSARGCAGARD